jgi:multimeric flavodoxin WrbA
MQVLLVNGSPRSNGETYTSLKIAADKLHECGIETAWFELGKESVCGCLHCNGCAKTNRCVQKQDRCNELIEAMLQADGIIIGSPVYFAGPNGALCALLDRAFYAASNFGYHFKGKPAAGIATCWRAGATATLDRLNKYFTFSQMPVVSSNYWNMKLTGQDEYGIEILETLAPNMAELLHAKAGK